MKKTAITLWVGLVVYTTFYVLFIQRESFILTAILNNEADPFASHFFNLMGLVPFYFLLDYMFFQVHKKYRLLAYLLGFVGGAFSILLGYTGVSNSTKSINRWIKVLIGILIIFSGFTFMQAFSQGNPHLFFSEFLDDALVGIMTIDFLVLYGWSIYRSNQLFQHWYLAMVPMIGFGLLMLLNKRKPIDPVSNR